jgi:hypothetical protein
VRVPNLWRGDATPTPTRSFVMSNSLPAFITLSAALAMSACSGYGDKEKEEYNQPPRITASPEPFRTTEKVTFTASVPGKSDYVAEGGLHPAILELWAAPVDKQGNRDQAAAIKNQAIFTAPDSTQWSTISFEPMNVPRTEPGGTLAVSVTYKFWKSNSLGYVPRESTTEEQRTVSFTMNCTAASEGSVAVREGSSVCTYSR